MGVVKVPLPLTIFFATGFGSGFLPFMPGTWATIVAIPIYLLLHFFPAWLYLLVVIGIIFLGFWLCGKAALYFHNEDPPEAAFDEVVGFLFLMLLIPMANVWLQVILGFIFFRLFDIWKPWPIKWIEKNVKGGYGIVADDLAAAMYAAIVIQVLLIFF